ncbi:hypothetical protein THICB1_110219 [Thiomonas arsenitoxydans]|uniref:Uncharacterized protein n=2 Tax=Thiomonas arsenitoxydans (strain DSM 22701 / CIP 110005 / 3As) TaxID=426114 RepID=A0ABP1YZF6_THIA3|nr:hypothetical protein THICB1_110219 [Thiomonas arsenitoxydans]CQR32268.1 hypothetical protein ACO3_30152 [Thiomonas arsenitoxydans]CQR34288.1 hypothetical protein ACO7_40089 [Thiomonas arsenitoxydans]
MGVLRGHPAKRGLQPQVEHAGPQFGRNPPTRLCRGVNELVDVTKQLRRLRGAKLLAQQRHIHLQGREHLTQIVMQVARHAGPLRLAHRLQMRGDLPQVAGEIEQLRFAQMTLRDVEHDAGGFGREGVDAARARPHIHPLEPVRRMQTPFPVPETGGNAGLQRRMKRREIQGVDLVQKVLRGVLQVSGLNATNRQATGVGKVEPQLPAVMAQAEHKTRELVNERTQVCETLRRLRCAMRQIDIACHGDQAIGCFTSVALWQHDVGMRCDGSKIVRDHSIRVVKSSLD